jgi:ubiquinol-cytochrome c reductase iron-sulfur subunit
MATYVLGGQPQVEGTLLFVAFGGLGAGFAMWARDLLPGLEITEPRELHHTREPVRVALVDSFERGGAAMARRPFLLKVLLPAGGLFGLAFIFPLASLGPRPHTSLEHTAWGPGKRLVTDDGRPIKIGDLPVNGILTVFPEGVTSEEGRTQAMTVLLNLGSAAFVPLPQHVSWSPIDNGQRYVAFSKVCTHAGCPVGLYNRNSQQLVCPCHQSTFDVLTRCNPVFGPASRSLPQLPMAVDQNGYLIAQSDYQEPVGPGFWNRSG